MRKERRIRILRRFVLGLAVAAFVAPAAQARVDELGGAQGNTGGDSTALIVGEDEAYVPQTGDATSVPVGEDEVYVPQTGDPIAVPVGEDEVYVPQTGDPIAVPVGGLSSPSTFDWGDAFIGAGLAFALMLLAGGAALGTRRRARPAAA